jgi:hypothetical protein
MLRRRNSVAKKSQDCYVTNPHRNEHASLDARPCPSATAMVAA